MASEARGLETQNALDIRSGFPSECCWAKGIRKQLLAGELRMNRVVPAGRMLQRRGKSSHADTPPA